MIIKKHLCGIHVAYPSDLGGSKKKGMFPAEGRPQGSLYSQQKKQIADAVFYLMSIARRDCRPLIFVATSPGFVDRANEPRFLKKFIDNLKATYAMENYVWVREFTGQGYPHFHFVANIPLSAKRPYTLSGVPVPFDVVRLSQTWSGYFGSDAKNSIRVGSKPDKFGRRRLYLSKNRRKAWYLAKYIGKSRSDDEVRTKAKIKAFSMDQKTSAAIVPQLFHSKYPTTTKAMAVWDSQARAYITQYKDIATGERIFENEKGELLVADAISWQRCGAHDVYIGFEKELVTH